MKFLNSTKLRAFSIVLASSVLFMACNSTGDTNSKTDKDSLVATSSDTSKMNGDMKHAQATLTGTYTDTALSGTAMFDQMNDKVKMVLTITVPSKANQSVAVHLHEHGECGDMGKDAHGHWNPTNQKHGKWGSESFHAGDIGNVKLDADGKGSIELETNLWTIGGDSTTNILNRAVIIHGGVDDFVTQPTGNAGGRIGCGVIQQ